MHICVSLLVIGYALAAKLESDYLPITCLEQLQQVWSVTGNVCASVGSTTNAKKTCCACAAQAGVDIPARGGNLAGIKQVQSFRYLGVDILTRSNSHRPTASKRCAAYVKRCSLIRLVNFRQRSALMSDANSALWLAAGTLYRRISLTLWSIEARWLSSHMLLRKRSGVAAERYYILLGQVCIFSCGV